MLISGIKSKPIYCTLSPDTSGLRHLLIAQGQGGAATERIYRALNSPAETEIYYSAFSILGFNYAQLIQELPSRVTRSYEHDQPLVADLREVFLNAQMGIRLYISGTEPFIWTVTNLALAFGVKEDEIQQELADSQARQIACVHCNALTYPVRNNIAPCAGCGRHLLVRDHFSRRLNAYMGVQVDAEVPGEIPEIVEVFVP